MTRQFVVFMCLAAGLTVAADAPLARNMVVVVLPFENPQSAQSLHWMREGVALLLGDELQARGVVVVNRDERTLAYNRLQLPVTATLSRASAIKVGHAVGATAIVTGQLALAGEALEVTARVVRLDTGTLSEEVVAGGPPAALFDVVARTAARLTDETETGGERPPPPSLAAFELFTRGLVAETSAAGQAYFEQALAKAPTYDAVRLALWELHTEQGDHGEALDSVTPVRPASALYRNARYAAAISQMALERMDEAFSTLRDLQGISSLPAVSNALGVVQLRRGSTPQTGRATYYFNQATELDPTEADYFFNLGYAYWQDRDANGAAYWLREAVRRDPGDGDAHFILSAALQRMGATTESARERELAQRLSSRYVEWQARATAGGELVPRGLERLHDRLDRPGARIDAFLASAGQRDQAELAAFHLAAARRAFDREADGEAERELRRALFLSPYLAAAHVLLGRIHMRNERPDDAVQAFKIAVWSEETPEALVGLAEAQLAAGDPASAREAVDRALALDSRFAPAAALKARLPPSRW